MQVKDQMVWMMLEERSKLHEEKLALQEKVESLQQDAQAKDRKIEALEVSLLYLAPVPCVPMLFCAVHTRLRRRGASSPDGWMLCPTERRLGRGGKLEAAVR